MIGVSGPGYDLRLPAGDGTLDLVAMPRGVRHTRCAATCTQFTPMGPNGAETSSPWNWAASPLASIARKPSDTDYSKCIGCHICADVCPTGYIQMGLGD